MLWPDPEVCDERFQSGPWNGRAGFCRALCAAGRDPGARAPGLGIARRCRRGAHRCPRPAAGREHPLPFRWPRRHRGFPARLFAFDQGGPGADGAGRGAAARAGRGDRRPPDRGQARRRRLVQGRRLRRASGVGLGLDARHHRPGDPSRRDPRRHRRQHREAARPADRAGCHPPGDAAPRLTFRAGPDHRGGAVARRVASRVPLFLRHAGRGRAHRGRRHALFQGLRRRHRRDRRRAPATLRCRRGREFPSNSRRCIRATRRCRASASWGS